MFRYFTKTDGLQVVINSTDIIGVEDMGEFRLILTPIADFEVIDTIQSIFLAKPNDYKFLDN